MRPIILGTTDGRGVSDLRIAEGHDVPQWLGARTVEIAPNTTHGTIEPCLLKRGVVQDCRVFGRRLVYRLCPPEVQFKIAALDEQIETVRRQFEALHAEKQAILDAAIANGERIRVPPFERRLDS